MLLVNNKLVQDTPKFSPFCYELYALRRHTTCKGIGFDFARFKESGYKRMIDIPDGKFIDFINGKEYPTIEFFLPEGQENDFPSFYDIVEGQYIYSDRRNNQFSKLRSDAHKTFIAFLHDKLASDGYNSNQYGFEYKRRHGGLYHKNTCRIPYIALMEL